MKDIISKRELAHRSLISDLIAKQGDDEVRSDMKDTAYTYRQLRTSLLTALSQMKQIQEDYGFENDETIKALRDIIGTVRFDELAIHEMHTAFSDQPVITTDQALTEIGASLNRINNWTF